MLSVSIIFLPRLDNYRSIQPPRPSAVMFIFFQYNSQHDPTDVVGLMCLHLIQSAPLRAFSQLETAVISSAICNSSET